MGDLTDADGLTAEGRRVLRLFSFTAASLSICGSLFIIGSFFYLRRTKQFTLRLVVFLSVFDALSHIGTFVEGFTDISALCVFAGWFNTVFQLSAVLWTGCISFHLWFSVFRGRKSPRLVLYYFLFAFGVPLLVAFFGLILGLYGPQGDVCWFRDPIPRVLLFYVPLWGCVLFNAVAYVVITREFRAVFRRHNMHQACPQLHRLKAYPMVLVLCWTVASVHRILNLLSDDDGDVYPFFLFALHFTLCKLQGLFNALVYGCDPSLFRDLKQKWLRGDSAWDPQRDDGELPEGFGGPWAGGGAAPEGLAGDPGGAPRAAAGKPPLAAAQDEEFAEVQL
eukprot:EG_transcript_11662